MSEHHDDAREEEGFFRTPYSVGKPRAQNGGQVHAAAVCADNTACKGFVYPQTSFVGSVVEVNQQDALHSVEGKTFPQFNMEEGGKLEGMPKEFFFFGAGGMLGHVDSPKRFSRNAV